MENGKFPLASYSHFPFSMINFQFPLYFCYDNDMPAMSVSWDLFIVIFFAIVMSYVFIMGKEQSMRIIIATYVSIIAVQGMGNVLATMLSSSGLTMQSLGIPVDMTMIALAKIFIFALCIIVFVLRSGIDVSYDKHVGSILTMVYTGLFGFATAGLLISAILLYAVGTGTEGATGIITPLAASSLLMQLMLQNHTLWYTLPALLIIGVGFLHND